MVLRKIKQKNSYSLRVLLLQSKYLDKGETTTLLKSILLNHTKDVSDILMENKTVFEKLQTNVKNNRHLGTSKSRITFERLSQI